MSLILLLVFQLSHLCIVLMSLADGALNCPFKDVFVQS